MRWRGRRRWTGSRRNSIRYRRAFIDGAGVRSEPRRDHHGHVSERDRRAACAPPRIRFPVCLDRTRRAAILCESLPQYLRAAGYYTTNRVKTDYQFGTPFTIWDGDGQGALAEPPDKSQPFFSVFNLMVTHESQIFPSSPRAERQAATSPRPGRSRCRRIIRTRRRSAKSWRACATTSPTWTAR